MYKITSIFYIICIMLAFNTDQSKIYASFMIVMMFTQIISYTNNSNRTNFFESLIDFILAEWAVTDPKFCLYKQNGGAAVTFRAIWLTFTFLIVTTTITAFLLEKPKFPDISITLSVFGGSYAAFYARFSAQWSLLMTLLQDINNEDNPFKKYKKIIFFKELSDKTHLLKKEFIKKQIKTNLEPYENPRVYFHAWKYYADRQNTMKNLEKIEMLSIRKKAYLKISSKFKFLSKD